MIENDSELLIKHNLMDYSLLMVIERLPRNVKATELIINNTNRYFVPSNRSVIHLGIIDYLQDFNINKKLEMKYKKMQVKDYKQEVAAVPAIIYGKRFQDFLKTRVFRVDRIMRFRDMGTGDEFIDKICVNK